MGNADLTSSGIYAITNKRDGKVYIGQALNFAKRWARHRWELQTSRHHNRHLQRAWARDGAESFVFEILLRLAPGPELAVFERFFITICDAAVPQYGYNLAAAGDSNQGVRYSQESRARMSKAQKGRIITMEARRKISQTLTGRKALPETVLKRAAKVRGQKRSPAQRRTLQLLQQQRSSSPLYEAFGRAHVLADWARLYGLRPSTLWKRVVRDGQPLAQALRLPANRVANMTATMRCRSAGRQVEATL